MTIRVYTYLIHLEIIRYNVTIIFILNAFVNPILWCVKPDHILLYCKRKSVSQKGLDKQIPKTTQRELNVLFENPNVDFAFKFSYIFQTVLFTFFYLPLVPIGIVISMLGLMLSYLVEKHNILKYYKRPEMPNHILAECFIDYFKLTLFVYNVTTRLTFLGRKLSIPKGRIWHKLVTICTYYKCSTLCIPIPSIY
jgi:hypothetical protein